MKRTLPSLKNPVHRFDDEKIPVRANVADMKPEEIEELETKSAPDFWDWLAELNSPPRPTKAVKK